MQQEARQKLGISIIIIGLLILIAIIYFGFFRNPTPAPLNPVNTPVVGGQLPAGTETTATSSETPRAPVNYDLSKEAPHKINASDVAKIAMAFAERFGSYSNQSSYSNFTDLKIMMTSSMKDWADKYASDLRTAAASSTAYYGITTNALTSEVKKFDESGGSASIIITTKRQETSATAAAKEAYIQKLDLDFKKVNGEWLVDRAYWEK